jgi:hypothetical protein
VIDTFNRDLADHEDNGGDAAVGRDGKNLFGRVSPKSGSSMMRTFAAKPSDVSRVTASTTAAQTSSSRKSVRTTSDPYGHGSNEGTVLAPLSTIRTPIIAQR